MGAGRREIISTNQETKMVGEVVEQSEERGSAANGGRHSQEAEMRRKRKPDETEDTQVLTPTASKIPKLSGREANINSKLPPELLTAIFRFLVVEDGDIPYGNLKSALLVCRCVQLEIKL